jgi:allantoinase
MKANNERDFIGYGNKPPDARWPNGARLALVIALNVEEGAEPSIPDRDPATETALTDGIREEVPAGSRDFVAESLFEYGSRVGFWRIVNLMTERGIPLTVNACAQALTRNPGVAESIKQHDFDLCCHGDRFIRHFLLTKQEERTTIARAIAGLEQAIGRRPSGWQSR